MIQVLTPEIIRQAAQYMQENTGVVLGFTYPGELFSVTYDYNDTKENIGQIMLEDLAFALNAVLQAEGEEDGKSKRRRKSLCGRSPSEISQAV